MKDVWKVEVLSWCCGVSIEGKRKQEGSCFCVCQETLLNLDEEKGMHCRDVGWCVFWKANRRNFGKLLFRTCFEKLKKRSNCVVECAR